MKISAYNPVKRWKKYKVGDEIQIHKAIDKKKPIVKIIDIMDRIGGWSCIKIDLDVCWYGKSYFKILDED